MLYLFTDVAQVRFLRAVRTDRPQGMVKPDGTHHPEGQIDAHPCLIDRARKHRFDFGHPMLIHLHKSRPHHEQIIMRQRHENVFVYLLLQQERMGRYRLDTKESLRTQRQGGNRGQRTDRGQLFFCVISIV